MLKGFETTPMFGAQMFGPQMFGPQMFAPQMFGAGQAQAMPQVLTAWNQGLQEIARAMADYSKDAFEDGSATYRQVMTAKSLEQAYELQTKYAQRTAQQFFQHVQKIGTMYAQLAQQAMQSAGMSMPAMQFR